MSTKNFAVRLPENVADSITQAIKDNGFKTNQEFLLTLVEMIPVYKAIQDNKLSIDDAIARLNSDTVITEYKVIKQGVNKVEFFKWKEKLFKYNENAQPEYRVFITQNLFLDLIGGNVNTLTKLYSENEYEILEHNNKMGVVKNDNRKLSVRIRDEYGSLAAWLRKKIG